MYTAEDGNLLSVCKRNYDPAPGWEKSSKVDSEGTPITDVNLPVYSGSTVKLAFKQKPYVLRDGVTYGTSLKLAGIQIVSINGSAGVAAGNLGETEVAALFGQTKGYKTSEPNITIPQETEEDDF
jgi:hypothetical protein